MHTFIYLLCIHYIINKIKYKFNCVTFLLSSSTLFYEGIVHPQTNKKGF